MPNVNGFLPTTRGFRFGNSWPSVPHQTIPTPFGQIAIGDASNGLCGGMVFAVRDYFEAGIVQPSGRRPAPGQPLFDFIIDRLYASFDLPNGPTKYYDWMTTADHDTWFKPGLARRMIIDEWPKIKADLDNDRLSCLGLVTLFSLDPLEMGNNHQVLVYGYDLGIDNVLLLRVYDPNSPENDDITISLSLDNPGSTTPITHNVNIARPIRGFFWLPYQQVSPPQIDDAEIDLFLAPMSMASGASASVRLCIKNTGTTSWASGGQNPYRLGSQRPQDSMRWGLNRVELPYTVNPMQTADFVFTVTAPQMVGEQQLPMGWRMVRELVQWFGELEERAVHVIGTPPPLPDPCDQLRDEILATEEEIRSLQIDLQTAVGMEKAFIVAQIKKKRAEVVQLRQAAAAQGCSNIP